MWIAQNGSAQRATGSLGRSEGDGQPGELLNRQDPTLPQRVAECKRVLAAAIAVRPLPLHPGLWVGQGCRGLLHHPSMRSLWCGYSCCPCGCPGGGGSRGSGSASRGSSANGGSWHLRCCSI